MVGWFGDAPRRRHGVVVLAAGAVLIAVSVWFLGLLLPASVPVPDDDRRATAGCDDLRRGPAPVEVRSDDLLACPIAFDGRSVVLRGEAVGDALRGPGGRTWIQLNDDAYASAGPLSSHRSTLGMNSGVAVLLPRHERPEVLGGPGVRGDVLRVTGVFEAASPADQGGPAVIADEVAVQRRGGAVQPLAAPALRWATGAAVVVLALLLGAVRRRRVLADRR